VYRETIRLGGKNLKCLYVGRFERDEGNRWEQPYVLQVVWIYDTDTMWCGRWVTTEEIPEGYSSMTYDPYYRTEPSQYTNWCEFKIMHLTYDQQRLVGDWEPPTLAELWKYVAQTSGRELDELTTKHKELQARNAHSEGMLKSMVDAELRKRKMFLVAIEDQKGNAT